MPQKLNKKKDSFALSKTNEPMHYLIDIFVRRFALNVFLYKTSLPRFLKMREVSIINNTIKYDN